MEEIERQENQQVLKVLQLLKQASHELQSNPTTTYQTNNNESNSSAIKALLELETESNTILSDPNLTQLSHHLSYLKTLVQNLEKNDGYSLKSFLRRRVSTHQISRVAESIELELQAWIDREFIDSLVKSLRGFVLESDLIDLLIQFQNRVSQGFNPEFQDLVLKNGVFSELEMILINPNLSNKLREECGFAIEALIRFNKNVFVGQVLLGPTIKALISICSISSLRILCSLIKSIKSALVDEIESNQEIPSIIGLLKSDDLAIRVLGFDIVIEIGYFGRKEAIEAMIKGDIVKKLVELQRSELGGDLIDVRECETEENRGETEEEIRGKQGKSEEENRGKQGKTEEENRGKQGSREKYLEKHPFASCVARFAVQLEVGEGLRQREKRGFKQEILRRIRESSLSDAEAATIQAEVLWGSFS